MLSKFFLNRPVFAWVIASRWGLIGDYGYMLYQSTTTTVFKRSADGTVEIPVNCTSSMVAGKTSLITASQG